jgi:hypothetical protein
MTETEKPDTFKEKYPFNCPKCGAKLSAGPSLSMRFGINSGHGSCLGCKLFLHLTIDPDLTGETMIAEPFSEYLEKK